MVWDGTFAPDAFLVKVKYAPPTDQGRRKVAHSFTAPLQYQGELQELGCDRPTPFGARAAVVGMNDITGILPALPLDQAADAIPGPILDILARAGVDRPFIRITGSRAIGLQSDGSDWDLVVPVAEAGLVRLRETLFDAAQRNELTIPPASGTWRLLDRLFPGGAQAIVAERRFIDTVQSGGASVALIFVPLETSGPLLEPGWQPAGRGLFHGTVTAAGRAAYKRAEYVLETAGVGPIRVSCYHKAANLIRRGDVLSIRGWLLRRDQELRLIQLLSVPDNIVWMEVIRH